MCTKKYEVKDDALHAIKNVLSLKTYKHDINTHIYTFLQFHCV